MDSKEIPTAAMRLMGARQKQRGKTPSEFFPVEISADGFLKIDGRIISLPDLVVASLPNLAVSSLPAVTDGYEDRMLSGSTEGQGIKVTGTATGAAVTIHTAIAGTTQKDYIELFACNVDTAERLLTLEWGNTTAPDGNITVTVPYQEGLVRLTPEGGLPLNGGRLIKAFAASANVIMIYGKVRRK